MLVHKCSKKRVRIRPCYLRTSSVSPVLFFSSLTFTRIPPLPLPEGESPSDISFPLLFCGFAVSIKFRILALKEERRSNVWLLFFRRARFLRDCKFDKSSPGSESRKKNFFLFLFLWIGGGRLLVYKRERSSNSSFSRFSNQLLIARPRLSPFICAKLQCSCTKLAEGRNMSLFPSFYGKLSREKTSSRTTSKSLPIYRIFVYIVTGTRETTRKFGTTQYIFDRTNFSVFCGNFGIIITSITICRK